MQGMMTAMMKQTMKKKGVASIEELRELCIEAEVKLIACQMTVDLFDMDQAEFIDGIAGQKRIADNEYLRNIHAGRFNPPVLTATGSDGREVQVQADESAFRFIFIVWVIMPFSTENGSWIKTNFLGIS